MKRTPFIFLVACLVALASFGASYFAGRSCCGGAGKASNEMDWLRTSFQLNQSQFGAVKALQESYQPTCDQLCQRIVTANEKLDRLIVANQSLTPEVEQALKESGAVREDCCKAMLGHIYQVAAQMSPESRERYLQMMKARITEPTMGHSGTSQPAHCIE